MTAPELVSGHIVAGKYAVERLLLQGGATATYHAITAPRREVALKMYDPALESFPHVLAALAKYQSVGARVPDALILPIVDSGTDAATGARYTVADFNPMPPLAQLVELCPVAVAEMPVLLRQLARAVDALHANDMAHLSLHPHNVFVGPGPKYEVRIGDFGASLVRGALRPIDPSGRWFPWLAPEQMTDPGAGGKAADIFSVALLAFFAVTGKSYWKSCLSPRNAEAWARELVGVRVPVSERCKELSVSLGPELDSVFARALAVDPARRFKTAREFSTAVDAALAAPKNVAPAARREKTVPRAASTGPRAPSPSQPRAPSPSQPQAPPLHGSSDDDDNVPTVANIPIKFLASRATMMGIGGDPIAQAIADAAAKAPSPTAPPVAAAAPPVAPVAPPAATALATAATVAVEQPPAEPTKSAPADTPNMVAVTPIPPAPAAAAGENASDIAHADTELPPVDPANARARRRSRIRSTVAVSSIVLVLGVGVLALASGGTRRSTASARSTAKATAMAVPTAEPAAVSDNAKDTKPEQPEMKAEPSPADTAALRAVPPGSLNAEPESSSAPESSARPEPAAPPPAPAHPRPAAAPAPRPAPARAPAPPKAPCGKFLKRCK
jgi:serine/threonine protein kinase